MFTYLINSSLETCIPEKSLNSNSHSLSKFLKVLINTKNKLRKYCQKNPNVFNRHLLRKFERCVRDQLKLFESKKFEKFINNNNYNLNFKDGSLWKFSKKSSKKSESTTVLYDNNTVELKSEKDRANAFAEYYATLSNLNNLGSKYFTVKIMRTVNSFLKGNIDLDQIKFTNYHEVVNTIKTLKTNKAAGHDSISLKVLKNLPRKAIVFIIKLVNGIFCISHFPSS